MLFRTSSSASVLSAQAFLIDEDVIVGMEDVRAPSAAETSNVKVGSPIIGDIDMLPSVTEI